MSRASVVTAALLAVVSCSSRGRSASAPADAIPPDAPAVPDAGDAPAALDLDGDGLADQVSEDFTGGAHCCYRVTIELGSGARIALPFDLDGGDLGRTAHYEVVTRPDGRPALRMIIATYAGWLEPLSREERAVGARSHWIEVVVEAGRAVVHNLGWSCDDAFQAIARAAWDAWEGLPAGCTIDALADALVAAETASRSTTLGPTRRPVTEKELAPGDASRPPLRVLLDGDQVVRVDLELGERRAPGTWPERGMDVRAHGAKTTIRLYPATLAR